MRFAGNASATGDSPWSATADVAGRKRSSVLRECGAHASQSTSQSGSLDVQ
jgi:hypothetical protein